MIGLRIAALGLCDKFMFDMICLEDIRGKTENVNSRGGEKHGVMGFI